MKLTQIAFGIIHLSASLLQATEEAFTNNQVAAFCLKAAKSGLYLSVSSSCTKPVYTTNAVFTLELLPR